MPPERHYYSYIHNEQIEQRIMKKKQYEEPSSEEILYVFEDIILYGGTGEGDDWGEGGDD